MLYRFLFVAVLLFSQCAPKSALSETKSQMISPNVLSNSAQTSLKMGEPTEKDVLWILMKNHDLPLSVSESCEGVGTSFADKTLGEYLSGFWQYHACEDCNNSLDIEVSKGREPGVDSKHWDIRFMINGQTEGEGWSWGVGFAVEDEGWAILRSSFQCLGAG